MYKEATCLWCGKPLIFKHGTGWVHKATGTMYIQTCPKCGWKGGVKGLFRCPRCGSELIDDHCALPKVEAKRK